MDSLTILVIADLHYVDHAGQECTVPERLGRYGLEFMKRAMEEAWRTHTPDVIVVLGDLVDDGTVEGAEQDLEDLRAAVREAEIPVIVVPGNHDGDSSRLFRIFGDRPGPHPIKGYMLYTFADPYAADDTATRPSAEINRFLEAVPDANVVAIQHNPIYPEIPEKGYPY